MLDSQMVAFLLQTNMWEFVRYLHVIDTLWLDSDVEAQGHPFLIPAYLVERCFSLLFYIA